MTTPFLRAGAAAVFCALAPISVQAQSVLSEFDPERSVELRSLNGNTQVVGELTVIEDGFLVVRTELGLLRISSDSVICSGPGCPAISDGDGFSIHVARDIELGVVAEVLRSYATDTGREFEFLTSDDPNRRVVRLVDPSGSSSIDVVYFSGDSGFAAFAGDAAEISIQSTSMREEIGDIVSGPAIDALTSPASKRQIARDGVVLAVHPGNPVRNLSRSEIAGVFSGEISNWLELGGGNVPITTVGLTQEQFRSRLFTDYVFDGADARNANITLVEQDGDVLDAVREGEGAIGFMSRTQAEGAKLVAIRENCGLLTAPTRFAMKTDSYPLTHPVYAYRPPQEIDPEAEALFDWMSSPRSQDAFRRAGYVDNGLDRINLEDMGMMLIHSVASEQEVNLAQYSGMLRELRDAERLSLSFRFESGSTDLDEESKLELADLGQRMQAGDFAGLEMLIVGFADSTGPASINTSIAEDRARAVRDLLVDTVGQGVASQLRLRPVSYGELLPLACNDEEVGRANNRRVEVWVRRLGARNF